MQYPEQTGFYKVEVKGKSSINEHDDVCIDISVGKEIHEGQKFLATMSWAKDRFNHVSISLGDSLQRYNYMFEQSISEDDALELSIKDGDDWLDRNMEAINILPSYSIRRWEDFRTRSDFSQQHQRTLKLYQTDSGYRQDLKELINNIWHRRYADNTEYNSRRFEFNDLSKRYLLEETTVYAQEVKDHEKLHVATSGFMNIFRHAQASPLTPNLHDLVRMRIDYRRNRSYGR